ncbi:hypothetical protein [Salinisphaera shabanensis]|uniref:hypothetical protein n=1 Tax=Salinisphaera shabanensis TaxID=180542 RepID=UPI00333F544F
MNTRTFYYVAETQFDDDGRVLPKKYVSGPYGDPNLARQVSRELGDDFHVFELTEFE